MREVPLRLYVINCTGQDVWLGAIETHTSPPVTLEVVTRNVGPEGTSVRNHHEVMGGVSGPVHFYRLRSLPCDAREALPNRPFVYEISKRIPLDADWDHGHTDIHVRLLLVYYLLGSEEARCLHANRKMRLVYEDGSLEPGWPARAGAPGQTSGSAGLVD